MIKELVRVLLYTLVGGYATVYLALAVYALYQVSGDADHDLF